MFLLRNKENSDLDAPLILGYALFVCRFQEFTIIVLTLETFILLHVYCMFQRHQGNNLQLPYSTE